MLNFAALLFTLQESEFSLEISIENLKLHPLGVFIIYEWEREDGSTCDNAKVIYEEFRNISYTSIPIHNSHILLLCHLI